MTNSKKILLIIILIGSPFIIFAQTAMEFKYKGDESYFNLKGQSERDTVENVELNEFEILSLIDAFNNYKLAINNNIEKEYINEIIERVLNIRSDFIIASDYYYENKEYNKAIECLEIFYNYPEMDIFKNSKIKALKRDTVDATILYHIAIMYTEIEDSPKAIEYFNKINSGGYIPNNTYKEENIYEFLVNLYKNDKEKQLSTAEYAFNKFKTNRYFIATLIGDYIVNEDYDKAIFYINKAIKYNKKAPCDYYLTKMNLLMMLEKMDEALKVSKQALKKDKDCYQALESTAYLYINKAINLTENLSTIKKDGKTKKEIWECYKKGEYFMTEVYNILESKNESTNEKIRILNSLKFLYNNTFYQTNDKEKKLENIDILLNKLIEN